MTEIKRTSSGMEYWTNERGLNVGLWSRVDQVTPTGCRSWYRNTLTGEVRDELPEQHLEPSTPA